MKEVLIRVRGFDDPDLAKLLQFLQTETTACMIVNEDAHVKGKGENIHIIKLLQEVGIPAKLKGFLYLQVAVEMCLKDRGMLMGVTKLLYPEVAKKCHSDVGKVEHAMRHAIQKAWEKNPSPIRDEIFKYTLGKKNRPTNAAFLATVTDYILLQENSDNNEYYPEQAISS